MSTGSGKLNSGIISRYSLLINSEIDPSRKFHLSHAPSRSSAPCEAFVLWPSVLRATIPLRPRFVPLCGLRSINASPRCRPLRLLASLRWLHIVFVPPAAIPAKAGTSLLPFAATVAHGRFHQPKRCSLSFIVSAQPFAA